MQFGKREGLDTEKKFTKVASFPPKVENSRPLQNVPIHAILQKKFFFLQIFGSGEFSTKVENFPISSFGLNLGTLGSPEE